MKKKQSFGISEQDELKYLGPILNKTFSKNLRAIKLLADTGRDLEDLMAA